MSYVEFAPPSRSCQESLKFSTFMCFLAGAMSLPFLENGKEMLNSALKTTLFAGVPAITAGGAVFWLGAQYYPFSEENAYKILDRASVAAAMVGLSIGVNYALEGKTFSQQAGALAITELAAGVGGFIMGKSYANKIRVGEQRDFNGNDFAKAGIRAVALTSLVSGLSGAGYLGTASLAGSAFLGNILAYQEGL